MRRSGQEIPLKSDVQKAISPIGLSAEEGRRKRAQNSAEYRAEQERIEQSERIARRVIRCRMDLGLTQQQLAERVGTSHSAISRIESGQHQPTVETLRRIAAAFDARLVIDFEPKSEKDKKSQGHVVPVLKGLPVG